MRKLFITLTVVSLLIVFGVLTFGENQVITIWSWRSQDAAVWQEVQKDMNAQGIPIEIHFTAFAPTQYFAKLTLALESKTGPDIAYVGRFPTPLMESYATSGSILPLNGEVNFSNFPQWILKQATYNGKVYGVPYAVQVLGIFYNKDIYNHYNLSVPKTWDDLIENAKILKAHGVIPFAISGDVQFTLAMQHAMCGVSILGPEWIKKLIDGETDFLSPKWVELNTLLDNLKIYYQPGFIADNEAARDSLFAFGKAAMVFYGSWGYQIWKQLNPNINVGYFMVPPLSTDQKPYAYAYMDGAIAMTSSCNNKDMALKLLNFVASPEFVSIFANITYNLPAVEGSKLPNDPLFEKVFSTYEHNVSPYVYWVGSVFVTQTPSLYEDVLSPGMQKMYAGKITPEQFAQMAEDAISKWYTPLQEYLKNKK